MSQLLHTVDAAAVEAAARATRAETVRPRHSRGWIVRRLLVLGDVAGLIAAWLVSGLLVHGVAAVTQVGMLDDLALLLAGFPLWVVLAKILGLYDRDGKHVSCSTVDDLGGITNALVVATLSYSLLARTLGFGDPNVSRLGLLLVSGVVFVSLGRAAARSVARSRPEFAQRALIVGADRIGSSLAEKFARRPEAGVEVVGFVDADPDGWASNGGPPVLGAPDELRRLIGQLAIDRVVVSFPDIDAPSADEMVRELRETGVEVDVVPRLYELIGPGVEIQTIEGMPLIGLAELRLPRSSLFLKRGLDLAVSSVALVLLLPLFLAIAAAIRLTSAGPVFFRQVRIGFDGKPFELYKFRTMVADADGRKLEFAHLNLHLRPGGDPRMFKIPNDPRVTRVGRVLRRYFLDELPQLLNVLRGEMSLIGPRPLILDEARFVDTRGRRRLDLKPGMTGMWQVLGRSAISFEEMVKLDYFYVTTWSLGRDVRLLLATIPLVFKGEAPV